MKKKFITLTLLAITLGVLLLIPVSSAQPDKEPTLEVINLSGTSYEFAYTQLFAMPKTTVNTDLYCDGALVGYGNWSGVLLGYLLTQTQAPPEVGSVQFAASDGYQVAIPIDLAMQPQIIIAYEKDGQPLAEGLRLIIPDANGASWIAKITSITISDSGAGYPASVSAGLPKANNTSPQSSATPLPSPKQQVPQPQQSIGNSSSSQVPVPINITQTYQPELTPQLANQNLNSQTLIVYLIAATCAISFLSAAYVVINRKNKQLSETK